MQQSSPKTQDLVNQVSLEELGVKVMIKTAGLFESPFWETVRPPEPSSTLWSWTATPLSLWQTRHLLCRQSKNEGISARVPRGRVAGRGTIIIMELNESSHTKFWDPQHSIPPQPLSLTLSLRILAVRTIPSRQEVRSTFSGQPCNSKRRALKTFS